MRGVFRALSAVALLCVAGCVSPEEVADQDAATCAGYGFKAGTEAFANCMMLQESDRRRAASVRTTTVCNQVGNTMICN